MNRDWHHNPSQGGSRTSHDYGNSGPIEPIRRESVCTFDYKLTMLTIFFAVIALVSL